MDENPDQVSFFPSDTKRKADKKKRNGSNKKLKQAEPKVVMPVEVNENIQLINSNSLIKIMSHDAPGETSAGENKIMVVIKGSPFTLRIARNGANIDFRYMVLSSILIYDQKNERQVAYLKKTPLETKSTLSEDGSCIDLECRISVLSSQHEDMNFRIRINALNPDNGLPFQPDILVYSDAIRVVSKPEQVRKKENKASTEPKTKVVSKNDESTVVAQQIHKSVNNQLEFLSNLLNMSNTSNLGFNNNQQQNLMYGNNNMGNYNNNNNNMLFNNNNNMNQSYNNYNNNNNNNYPNNQFNPNNNYDAFNQLNNQYNQMNSNSSFNNLFSNTATQYNPVVEKEETFESVFLDFVNCYANLDHQEKSNNIRRYIKTSTQRHLETLGELTDLIALECSSSVGDNKEKVYVCNCKDCIYKKELSQVDSFYRDWDVN